jgi:hypothetical protein
VVANANENAAALAALSVDNSGIPLLTAQNSAHILATIQYIRWVTVAPRSLKMGNIRSLDAGACCALRSSKLRLATISHFAFAALRLSNRTRWPATAATA